MLPKQNSEQFYLVALSLVDGIGSKTARNLLQHFGSARAIFEASPKELKSISGLGELRATSFKLDEILPEVELQLQQADKHNIQILAIGDEAYPKRLLHCDDAPILVYYKGKANLNAKRICAIIGTRKNTDYGQRCTEALIEQLEGLDDLIIVSGLALGIDTLAHKASLKHQIPTIGVVGHGLDRIYPHSNLALSAEMLQTGGILTEFPWGTKLSPQNFPVRNRLVAGMSDITVLVESDIKGGGMITAYIAASYNREVAAFPGRIYDSKSDGPNHLIKKNIAALINSGEDLMALMNWDQNGAKKAVQQQLFIDLSPEEHKVIALLESKDALHTDDLMVKTGFNYPQLATVLLQLEMQNLIKTLPGKMYRLN